MTAEADRQTLEASLSGEELVVHRGLQDAGVRDPDRFRPFLKDLHKAFYRTLYDFKGATRDGLNQAGLLNVPGLVDTILECQKGINAFDALRSCMRPKPERVSFLPGSNQSEKHTGDVRPTSVKPWDVKPQILHYFEENKERLRAVRLPFDPRPDEEHAQQTIRAENTTLLPAFDASATQVVNSVFEAEGKRYEFSHCSMPGNIVPDFMLAISATDNKHGYSASFVVGEAKLPGVLEDEGITVNSNISELFEKYQADCEEYQADCEAYENAQSSQESHEPLDRPFSRLFGSVIPQIFGYMEHGGYVYGFLTTLKLTWVLRRLRSEPKTLYVSEAFDRREEEPSVPQALYWLARQACDCEDKPYTEKTVRENVEGARRNQEGGQPEEHKDKKMKPETRRERYQRRTGGPVAGSAPTSSEPETLELGETLGEGVSGIVYRGKFGGRIVAVKMADVFNSQDIVSMLDNEVSAFEDMAPLQGRCLPELVADGHACGGLARFVATSLITGQRLDEAVGTCDAQLASALKGLRSMHAFGWLHGDLRGPNVLLVEDGTTVVFIDLGYSRRSSSVKDKKHEEQQLRALFRKQACTEVAAVLTPQPSPKARGDAPQQ